MLPNIVLLGYDGCWRAGIKLGLELDGCKLIMDSGCRPEGGSEDARRGGPELDATDGNVAR